MYRREEYRRGKYNVVRLSGGGGSFFEIIPALGAMVYQAGLSERAGNILEILKSDSDGELMSNPWFRGRVLFPFNDRIPDGIYNWRGREYELTPNDSDGSAIHGLVYNRPFVERECLLSSKSADIMFSCYLKGDDRAYPFPVSLEIRYRLDDNGFSAEYRIMNRGEETLPVALGWHPYFALSGQVNNWKLQCAGERFVEVDGNLNPTGNHVNTSGTELDFSRKKRIGGLNLDLAFTAPPDGTVLLEDGSLRLTLRYERTFFPYIQIFIPPDRESIAIEPVTAATNAFNLDGLGRLELEPGEERSGAVHISLNRC